jgi:hypothetical protein
MEQAHDILALHLRRKSKERFYYRAHGFRPYAPEETDDQAKLGALSVLKDLTLNLLDQLH